MSMRDIELLNEEVHLALVSNNLEEFGNSGYDGMSELCNTDHAMILWNEGAERITTVSRFIYGKVSMIAIARTC